jgi:VanZ family protein
MTIFTKLKPYIPGVLWLLIILILSSYPGNKIPKLPDLQLDKFVHTFSYGILIICMGIPYAEQFLVQHKRWSISLKLVLFVIFYGGLMEVLQTNVFINRSGNWYDFFANTLGAILGVLLFPYVIKVVPIIRWLKIR